MGKFPADRAPTLIVPLPRPMRSFAEAAGAGPGPPAGAAGPEALPVASPRAAAARAAAAAGPEAAVTEWGAGAAPAAPERTGATVEAVGVDPAFSCWLAGAGAGSAAADGAPDPDDACSAVLTSVRPWLFSSAAVAATFSTSSSANARMSVRSLSSFMCAFPNQAINVYRPSAAARARARRDRATRTAPQAAVNNQLSANSATCAGRKLSRLIVRAIGAASAVTAGPEPAATVRSVAGSTEPDPGVAVPAAVPCDTE